MLELEIDLTKLVETRKKLGYSQTEVGKVAGHSKYTWCRKEKGAYGISLKEALAVAKFFKMPVEELFPVK